MVNEDSITLKAFRLLFSYKTFRNTYNFLKKSQNWDETRLEEYQIEQLSKLLEHSYENVPYYTRIFDENGLKTSDIQDFKDLRLLPYLNKDLIRNNLKDLKAKNFSQNKFEYVTTGGTSGKPLGFYYERGVSRAQEWAYIKSLWEEVGYNFRDKCVILKGNVVESSDKGKYWGNTFFGRWLLLSSYHMTDKNLFNYVKKIKEFKPKFIQAYPSTITILASFMKKNSIKPFDSIKAILCGSENFYKEQRELVEDVFNCRTFTWYGHSERTLLAGECEESSKYHLFPQYGVFELVNSKGKILKNKGTKGEIVGTGLTNYIMPLIRYKTDDMTSLGDKCNCNKNYQIIENVTGRWTQEFIVSKEGNLIPITAINMHSNVFDSVEQFQFLQEIEGQLIIRIVKKGSYTYNDTQRIKYEIIKKLGKETKLEFQFLDEIPRTSRGKYRFLIQKLPLN
jgi:phenylacetate-CoA ligase